MAFPTVTRSSALGPGWRRRASAVAGQRGRIVILGDSITAGFGLSPAEAYPAVLQRKVDEAGLRAAVRAAKAEKKDVICLIAGDKEARHGDVTHVIDVVKQEGVAKFAINIDDATKVAPAN